MDLGGELVYSSTVAMNESIVFVCLFKVSHCEEA